MGKGQRSEVQKKRKSRDAARQRRGQQNDEFSELASHLPLPFSVSSQLDRLCIMRLTNSYVKVKHVIKQIIASCPFGYNTRIKYDPESYFYDASALDALGGFVFVVSMDGQCVYTSPNIIDYLGISQLEMTGCSMYKFVHPCDQDELAKHLDGQVPLEDMEIFDGLFCADNSAFIQPKAKKAGSYHDVMKPSFRSFFLRMKSTITSRGKSVNLNASIFRVVHCLGSMHYYCTSYDKDGDAAETKYLVAIGMPLLSSDSFEVPLDRMTFTTTHGLDMKLLSCEEHMNELLGFSTAEMKGKSWYCFTHACDTDVLKSCHITVLSKGQCVSGYYRMMTRSGGWVWMQTKGNVVYSNVSFQPQYIICVNYLISGVEAEDQLLSTEQTKEIDKHFLNTFTSRKRESAEIVPVKQPAIKLAKSDLQASLTPPYSDEEVDIKPWISHSGTMETNTVTIVYSSGKAANQDLVEVSVPTSGEEDMKMLCSQQKYYEDKLAEEYSVHLKEDKNDEEDDDYADDLPSLEFVTVEEEFDDAEMTHKSFGELLEDESFLARAPFIPPPTVDQTLNNLLDTNEIVPEDELMTVEKYDARAPYIPDTSFDVPLSFDELETSPLPLVPEFQQDEKSLKLQSCSESCLSCLNDKSTRDETISKEKNKSQGKTFNEAIERKQVYSIGSTNVPRDVIQYSIKAKKHAFNTQPKEKLIISDSEIKIKVKPRGLLCTETSHTKGSNIKRKINLGKEALVLGRMSAMPYITKDDAEVNAPTTSLLHGPELLSALDFVS